MIEERWPTRHTCQKCGKGIFRGHDGEWFHGVIFHGQSEEWARSSPGEHTGIAIVPVPTWPKDTPLPSRQDCLDHALGCFTTNSPHGIDQFDLAGCVYCYQAQEMDIWAGLGIDTTPPTMEPPPEPGEPQATRDGWRRTRRIARYTLTALLFYVFTVYWFRGIGWLHGQQNLNREFRWYSWGLLAMVVAWILAGFWVIWANVASEHRLLFWRAEPEGQSASEETVVIFLFLVTLLLAFVLALGAVIYVAAWLIRFGDYMTGFLP